MHEGKIMSRTFVIGDIHGAHRALVQCLQRAGFDYEKDHLISLGDVCDGWPETKHAIDELMRIKNLTYIFGNHDFWTLEWMRYGLIDEVWWKQGGEATIKSFTGSTLEKYQVFFEQALPYLILNNKLFVHAGINPLQPLHQQSLQVFLWDRALSRIALDFYHKGIYAKHTEYDEVYLGHTPIPFEHPVQSGDIWLMDTGAGWSGVLSMMDINTKEIFRSDPVPSLYPGVQGRRR
ncbi:MAG: metallophosphoesterase [Cyclobacteriaceae bacterium]|nr:metallophosphoesterase [Cyclobacteriaceae bacterium]UYN87032.1 MAG: metallophosphoesterase [Cyclobacteriaceae bacterium]